MKTYQLIWKLFKADRSLKQKVDVKELFKITQQAYEENFTLPPELRAKWEYIINYVPKTSITVPAILEADFPNTLKINEFEKY